MGNSTKAIGEYQAWLLEQNTYFAEITWSAPGTFSSHCQLEPAGYFITQLINNTENTKRVDLILVL